MAITGRLPVLYALSLIPWIVYSCASRTLRIKNTFCELQGMGKIEFEVEMCTFSDYCKYKAAWGQSFLGEICMGISGQLYHVNAKKSSLYFSLEFSFFYYCLATFTDSFNRYFNWFIMFLHQLSVFYQ